MCDAADPVQADRGDYEGCTVEEEAEGGSARGGSEDARNQRTEGEIGLLTGGDIGVSVAQPIPRNNRRNEREKGAVEQRCHRPDYEGEHEHRVDPV